MLGLKGRPGAPIGLIDLSCIAGLIDLPPRGIRGPPAGDIDRGGIPAGDIERGGMPMGDIERGGIPAGLSGRPRIPAGLMGRPGCMPAGLMGRPCGPERAY